MKNARGVKSPAFKFILLLIKGWGLLRAHPASRLSIVRSLGGQGGAHHEEAIANWQCRWPNLLIKKMLIKKLLLQELFIKRLRPAKLLIRCVGDESGKLYGPADAQDARAKAAGQAPVNQGVVDDKEAFERTGGQPAVGQVVCYRSTSCWTKVHRNLFAKLFSRRSI